MGGIRVDLLGVVRVSCDGRQLTGPELGGRRSRIALAALALHRRPVSASRLAELIWAGDPPASWPAALRNVVSDLRAALARIGLGEQLLVTTGPNGYGLVQHRTDVQDAERDTDHAERALADQRPAEAVRLIEAVGRWRGEDLLPGEDDDWLRPHRAALDALRARGLELTAVAAGLLGDHHRAVAAARTLVADDPVAEPGHRLLITALDRAGDRAGVAQAYENCRSLLADRLGVDPSAETVEVYVRALRSDSLRPGTRLPAPSGALIGRGPELAGILAAIDGPGCVTVAGRGGVGKTRLALETARRVRGSREVRWVELGTVTDDQLVAAQLALELGVDPAADLAQALGEVMAPLGRTLLVLDSCEDVADGAATLISALLADCPMLTVLATSRRPLNADLERRIELPPLADPDLAVALLRTRAAEQGRDLPDDAAGRRLLHTIAARCGGLPLALELVAAHLVDMSPADLVEDLPMPGESDQLTAMLRHSYEMLDLAAAGLFRRMAALAGPVSLPLLRAVAGQRELPPLRVTRMLGELAAGGLIVADRSGPRWRYRQDDDVRRFAGRLLAESGEEPATLERLAEAIRGLLPADPRSAPAPFAAAITEVAGSLRALFTACLSGRLDRTAGLEIAFRLHRYWAATAVAEGRFWLSRLLAGAQEGRWTALASFAHGYLVYWAGDAVEAAPALALAVERLRGVDDSFAARALIYLAGITDDLDRGEQALSAIREAAALAEQIGDARLYVGAAMGVGSVLAERGDPRAADAAVAALGSCRELGDPDQLAGTLPTAAMICWQVGALETARALAAEARPLLAPEARIARVVLLSVSAAIALADRDAAAAVDYGRAADRDATDLGVDRELPLIRCVLARALLAAGDPAGARERAAAALTAARQLSYQGPLALALETAAAVLADDASPADRNLLLSAASDIRIRGSRPAPPTLSPPVHGGGVVADPGAAGKRALELLA